MRKRVIPLLALFLMLALMPANVAAHTADDPFSVELIAGGGNPASAEFVGEVQVWNDGDNLYVKFVTVEDWCLLETHLSVAESLDGIPQTKKNNNPIPGHFEYSSTHLFEDCVTEMPYTVPLAWDYGTDVYIAAHAVVVSTTEKTTVCVVSEPGVDAFGPYGQYYGLDDPNWGASSPAVGTWIHPSWPSIPDATWISTAYYVEDPPADTWRKFHDEVYLPEKGCYLTGSIMLATSDNAEAFYFNGEFVGADGEVQGDFTDDYEWSTIVEYPVMPVPGTNSIDFIVRNYPQAGGSETSNPTGLIYKACFDCYREETAWGAGDRFNDKNWATYFKYEIQEPYKVWNLPTCPIDVRIDAYPGTSNNYFDLELWDVGTGYDISDGVWPGWCADSDVFITYQDYTADVYSSYDPNLPSWASDDEQWDYINYILNHKHPSASMDDIQQAIWYFADAGYPMPTDPEAAAMVNDALANGAGFHPVAGQVGAVILAIQPTVQLVFIEVDP
ncbi:MAG: hypothetical protein ACFFFC_18705 [Candidatus Thorarchaeota archaeon]